MIDITPELLAFAGELGRNSDCRYLICPECDDAQQMIARQHSGLEIMNTSLKEASSSMGPELMNESVILCSGLITMPGKLFHLKKLMDKVPLCIVTEPDSNKSPKQFERWLLSERLNVEFTGYTGPNTLTAVIGNSRFDKGSGNSHFKVVALLCAYNEADIIEHTLRYLLHQGIYVYVLENWSLDSTWEKIQPFINYPHFIGCERFPQKGPDPTFNWLKILERKKELSQSLRADWFIHYDIDEIRMSPWPQLNLMEAIRYVDQMGFNAIDHTVLEFQPVDNGFTGVVDFGTYFKYFEFGKRTDHFQQVKAWKNTGKEIELVWGGHNVSFDDRKVCPYKFIMRHYPVRSQAHGERKVFIDRQPRWNPEERATNHHTHYDHIDIGHSFVRSPEELKIFHPKTFFTKYLAERLTGINIST
ncbi:glycosyltransferase family 2 protein [Paenibacillus beijingensis]|uniref:Glycosyl transferase family 2 n=1 Tax=Paenibacillus beijingensis TaxID=1126833 RepID=A0A0D5NP80_9BACL|nr:glycosyltransferase family 2 protein [Paenibacillus beijingensis]AJY76708.1 hypothetical protein VN24_21715 [Paenibacillus beijingensis]